MIKSTEIKRYKEWCKTAKKSDTFTWQGRGYTQKQFDELHFGGSSEPKDVEVKDEHNLEQELDSGHTEES